MGYYDSMWGFDASDFVGVGQGAAVDESVSGGWCDGWSIDGRYFSLYFTEVIHWSDNDFRWDRNDVKK